MLSCKYYVSNIPVNMGIFLLEKILKLKKKIEIVIKHKRFWKNPIVCISCLIWIIPNTNEEMRDF